MDRDRYQGISIDLIRFDSNFSITPIPPENKNSREHTYVPFGEKNNAYSSVGYPSSCILMQLNAAVRNNRKARLD